MENKEILDHFSDAKRVFGTDRLPFFTIYANSKVYRCARPQAEGGHFFVNEYDRARGVNTIGYLPA